jgi:hypothetical protein
MISEENEQLLQVHLDFLARHTTVPYTIYAVVKSPTRPEIRKSLEQNPRIRIFNIPKPRSGVPAQQVSYEHSIYLRKLTDIAVEDDITHLAVLHADSFPIKPWVEELAAKLNDKCPVAAIMRLEDHDRKPHCSGMFFSKAFYALYQPTFRLSPKIMDTELYRRYRESHNNEIIGDTGVGFGYRLWLENLNWCPLIRSNKVDDGTMGGIYGDLLYHLGGAVRKISRNDYRDACAVAKKSLFRDPEEYIRYLRG